MRRCLDPLLFMLAALLLGLLAYASVLLTELALTLDALDRVRLP